MSQDLYPVKPHIRERAHIKTMEEYQRLYRLSLDNPEWFWGEQAKTLTWFHPWQSVFDADYKEVDFSWTAICLTWGTRRRSSGPRTSRASTPTSATGTSSTTWPGWPMCSCTTG